MATNTPYKVFKETSLPGTLQANSIYLIAPSDRPDFVEMYVTGTSASSVKRIIDQSDVNSLIDDKLDSFSRLEIVDTIAERDELSLSLPTQVLVLDATSDSTVESGAATYIFDPSEGESGGFKKISEAESLDLNITFENISGGPSSSSSQIDNAVSLAHQHANKSELDKIGQNSDGNLTYEGDLPVTGWNSTGW